MPANKTLSGIKSQEYKGSRYNELVFDDTTGEIRSKFSSEHGKTQLNQGYLIHPRSEGQDTSRGEGFELRTDNSGAIRAAQGLLLTTEAQNNANGQQLDKPASQAQLEAAQNLMTQLSDTANNQHANKPTPDKLDTDHLKNKEPYLQLHGQGGIALTTPQSIAIATDKDFNQIAQRDTHQTSGRRWIHNIGESISLFVTGASNKLKESIKLIAAKGNIQIQAQSNDIEITADKKITITACKEKLTASAKKEFLLIAGGGYIKMQGGNIEIAAPKNLSMKAGSFEHAGAVSQTVIAPPMPNGDYNPIKPGIAGFDDTTFLGGMANGVLNQAAVVTSALRKDGLMVQPFTGVVVSKPDQQDAKFNNLVGVGGVVTKLGKATSFASKFITAPNQALFWSGLGRGGDKVAADVALKQEKTTLEQLIKKNDVDMPTWDAESPKSVEAWKNASKSFAEGASGQVKVVTGDKIRPGSIWETFELPALKSNPSVSEIIQIDSVSGLEKTIFVRPVQ